MLIFSWGDIRCSRSGADWLGAVAYKFIRHPVYGSYLRRVLPRFFHCFCHALPVYLKTSEQPLQVVVSLAVRQFLLSLDSRLASSLFLS